jgi:hypothetical protein
LGPRQSPGEFSAASSYRSWSRQKAVVMMVVVMVAVISVMMMVMVISVMMMVMMTGNLQTFGFC